MYAQHKLAICYIEGQGVPTNKTEAVRWLRKAADQNHLQAQFDLDLMYYTGWGVRSNKEPAVKRQNIADKINLQESAANGDAQAQFLLAQTFFNYSHSGKKGTGPDPEKAAFWYLKAANQGHANAQLHIAMMYMFGDGIKKDMNESIKWLRKSALNGNLQAKELLDAYDRARQ